MITMATIWQFDNLISYFLFMGIYRVTKWYRVKARIILEITGRNYFHPLPFYFQMFCLWSPTKIKSEIHVCLKSVVRGPLNNIFLSINKELGKSKVSLFYHIPMKIFRRVLIIRCWRSLLETIMVYSRVIWKYLTENFSWFSTIKSLKVSSRGLCQKTI